MHAGSGLDQPAADPWTVLKGWRLWGEAKQHVRFGIDGEIVEGTVTFLEGGGIRAELAGAPLAGASLVARVVRYDGRRIVLDLSERIATLRIVGAGGGSGAPGGLHVLHDGRAWSVTLPGHAVADADADAALSRVTAPLPGKVVKTAVRGGERVERGATLVVLEAMKMELSVEAPRAGVVEAVTVSAGEQVAEGAVLVTFADTGADAGTGDPPE